jgi:hypothetical protein
MFLKKRYVLAGRRRSAWVNNALTGRNLLNKRACEPREQRFSGDG